MTKKEAIDRKEFLLGMCIAYMISRKNPVNGWTIEQVREEYLELRGDLEKGVFK